MIDKGGWEVHLAHPGYVRRLRQNPDKTDHSDARLLADLQRVGFIVTNMTGWSRKVVKFYNGRGTAEQWIKEGKYAVKWTRLSCRNFRDNQARLQLFALAYNLGNFLRRLALPRAVKHWSLTTLREKLIKIGAKVVRHSGYVIFQMAEVAAILFGAAIAPRGDASAGVNAHLRATL